MLLRDREHAVGAACRAGNERPEEEAVTRAHQARVPLEGEIVHGHDRRPPVGGWDDVVEVGERGPQPAQRLREPVGHPCDLAAGG